MRSCGLFSTQRSSSAHQATCSEFCRASYLLSIVKKRQGFFKAVTRCVLTAVETSHSHHNFSLKVRAGVSTPVWTTGLAREFHISQDQAALLALHQPCLCNYPPTVLKEKICLLAEVLPCPLRTLAQWAFKNPAVLEYTQQHVAERVSDFARTFSFPSASCEQLFIECPLLLARPPALVRKDISAVASLLGIPLHALFRMACKYTGIFSCKPAEVEQKIIGLQQLFNQSKERAIRMITRCPRLLILPLDIISLKVTGLAQSLSVTPSQAGQLIVRCPVVLQYSTQRMEDQIQYLCQDIAPKHVRTMVFRDPELLSKSAAVLLRNMSSLQALLQCTRQEVLEYVLRRPSLLTCSTSSLTKTYNALSIWKFSAEEKLQLLKAHPLLLRLSVKEVYGRCRFLRLLMLSSAYYHSTLRRIPMKLIGIIILHLPYCWGRLLYLLETHKYTSIRLMDSVQWRDECFHAHYPDYCEWKTSKVAAVGCEVPWRMDNGIRLAMKSVDKYLVHLAARLAKQKVGEDGQTVPVARFRRRRASNKVDSKSQPEVQSMLVPVVMQEATEVFVGKVRMLKPRRVVYQSMPADQTSSTHSVTSSASSQSVSSPSTNSQHVSSPDSDYHQPTINHITSHSPNAHNASSNRVLNSVTNSMTYIHYLDDGPSHNGHPVAAGSNAALLSTN